MTRALVVSTYELGVQPLGAAVPASWLAEAGLEVRACDLSVDGWPAGDVAWADVVVLSVPMHTAMRLALGVLERLRAARPDVPVAFLGLYAESAIALGLVTDRDLVLVDGPPAALVEWALGTGVRESATGRAPDRPLRTILPPLERYARLVVGDTEHLVGAVESTEGCNHRCRHCPVPVVFHGRSRALSLDAVLTDVGQLVDAGATHLHFADPDFLNRPAHALRVARAVHAAHRELTFDITAKVSHLVRFGDVVAELAGAGLSFIVSAFETTSPLVLERLDKGHTPEDMTRAVLGCREAGVEIRPSLMPFTPWTTRRDLVELVDFVASHDLVWNVDPVHFSIRLLLPPGSLLLENPDDALAHALGSYDPQQLGRTWRAEDPLLDELQVELAGLTEAAAACGEDVGATYAAVRARVFDVLGEIDPGRPALVVPPGPPGPSRPHLSESWFCCAEPTAAQQGRIDEVPGPAVVAAPVRLLASKPTVRP